VTAVAFTAQEWADRLARPIKDRRYQSTRTGQAVAFGYLPWKRLSAAAATLDQYERDLARGCIAFPDHQPGDWTAGDIVTVLNLFPEGSRKRALAAWRDFLTWAADWNDQPELHRQLRMLPRLKQGPTPVYEIFEPYEQERLLANLGDVLPKRELLALLVVMLGPRKGELQELKLEHFNHGARVVLFHGKGNKERIVPFGDELYLALLDFLEEPVPRVRMRDRKGSFVADRAPLPNDYLFFPYGTRGDTLLWTDPSRAMSKTAMHRWWGRAVERAGIKYRHLHMNRHTTGTELVEAGADAFTVMDWLGHARVDTTQVYVHNSRQRLRGASDKLTAHRRRGA
jgi:site-specific recombinase XerD